MCISDWSSDVCSSDLGAGGPGPKQLASVAGKALVELALEAARGAGLDEVVLVEGAVDLSGHAGGATLLRNPRWEEGLATSLQVALAHARAEGHDAVVVGPSDQPGDGTGPRLNSRNSCDT